MFNTYYISSGQEIATYIKKLHTLPKIFIPKKIIFSEPKQQWTLHQIRALYEGAEQRDVWIETRLTGEITNFSTLLAFLVGKRRCMGSLSIINIKEEKPCESLYERLILRQTTPSFYKKFFENDQIFLDAEGALNVNLITDIMAREAFI